MQRKINRVFIVLSIALALVLGACGGSPVAQEPTAAPAQANPTDVNSPTFEGADPGSETTATARLNLNEATGDEFMNAIPGFSSRMVREFLEYRPYISIQQFRREIGKYVSAEQVAEYERYVFVPVDVNESDKETLKQLPGVDETIAAELIAGRPFASNDAFLEKLASYVSEANVKLAQAYLIMK
jgi:DNA uptake protein ComE-like DNA-binding protein